MASDDPLSAALAPIRARSAAALEFPLSGFPEDSIRACTLSAKDVPVLLRCLDAVLELADTLPPQAPPSSALEEDRMWVRQECADMIREAIARELAGKEDSDD